MDFCLQHMPDDRLEEAEALLGFFRCRNEHGTPGACHSYAVEGTDPPRCSKHRQTGKRGAGRQAIFGQVDERAAEIIALYGTELANPQPVSDPYQELMRLGGEMRVFKDLMRDRVALLEPDKYRYTGKTGEQIRAELILYERAIERFAAMLVAIAKLNLDARLVGIRQQTLAMLDQALTLAFTKAKVPPERQVEARETFRSHVKLVS
jgi:hypothetical protein